MSIFPQLHGVITLNKPSGPSSAQCLSAFKKQGQKKIGHAGTLDPMAKGALVVLLGQATKLSGWLMTGGKKVYSGAIRLGLETDTWDCAGRITAEKSWAGITTADIEAAIQEWRCLTSQEVPAYSAAKHHGQPLYKLARKGQQTPVKHKDITIFEADMLDVDLPYIRFRVSCSSGAYIRSLAHSLGVRLGCGAALYELTREYSHPFGLDRCLDWADISSAYLPAYLAPMTEALPDWPKIELSPAQVLQARNGCAISASQKLPQGAMAFLCEGGSPLALGRLSGNQWLIERGLWTN